MIPLGIVSSSVTLLSSPPPEPTLVSLVQEWSIASPGNAAKGAPTMPGNLLIARAIHRLGSSGVSATIYDDAGNTWQSIASVPAGGSGDVAMWYCENANSTSEVNVAFDGLTTNRYISIVEWEGIAKTGALVDWAARHNTSQAGNLPMAEIENTEHNVLVAGTLGATVSNRSIVLTEASLADGYVMGFEQKGSQTTLTSATRVGAGPGYHAPQWVLSGSPSTTGVITAGFRPAVH